MESVFNQITYIEVGEVFIGVTIFVVIVYLIKLVIHVVIINDQIEKLHQRRDEEISRVRKTPGMTISGFEDVRRATTERYSAIIDPLVRKKGYIFDILPFLTKK